MTYPFVKDQLNNLKPMNSDVDVLCIMGFVLAFGLPLTLLFPSYAIWSFVPKISVTRLHLFEQELTWFQMNAAVMTVFTLLFCFYLEVRKRVLDELVDNVISVSQTTEATMQVEKERQKAAMKLCVDLLDSSSNHYEHLVLLRDDLRRRELANKQMPPVIELSSFEL